jgi:hypothetical protein
MLARIRPNGQHEVIRPRAIHFDDKHENFTVFADYLVPYEQEPSLSPRDFNAILDDGNGLHSDRTSMWYITNWDVKLQRINPHSDHFDLDHYDFYDPYRGNFVIGSPRGRYTIGDLAKYFNSWRQ